MMALLLAASVLYVHPERLLSIRFPGQPIESDQQSESPVGVIRFKGASLEDERRSYAATAIVYPLGGTLDVEKMLANARDQTVKNVRGKIVSERPIKIDGFPGREIKFEAGRVHGVARLFARAGPPVLIAVTALRKTGDPDPDQEKFLESLHFGRSVETK